MFVHLVVYRRGMSFASNSQANLPVVLIVVYHEEQANTGLLLRPLLQ
jgi:hypothetical protein